MQKPQPKIMTDAELKKDEDSNVTHQWEKLTEEGIARCVLCNKYVNIENVEGTQVADNIPVPFPMI